MKDERRVICQGRVNYLFVIKSRTVMIRANRERLQPIRVMYVIISWSLGAREGDTCRESTKITFSREMLPLYFIAMI